MSEGRGSGSRYRTAFHCLNNLVITKEEHLIISFDIGTAIAHTDGKPGGLIYVGSFEVCGERGNGQIMSVGGFVYRYLIDID